MKGDPQVIEGLNEVLTAELTAINQYFVHAKMCQNWGYLRLAAKNREESIDEMRHADRVMDRILYLDGVPNMQRLFPIKVGETVPEQLANDLELEVVACERLNRLVEMCRQKGDNGSRELLETILVDEEEHRDWLEAQLGMVEEIGKENYLAQQMHSEG